MNKLNFPAVTLILLIAFTASSCDLVAGIFKAGFWTAIIVIVLIVALVAWLVGKTRNRR
ncbi:MAG TPA: hypothetical protein VF145_06925 [Chitinophagaceae bacterium]